MRLPRPMFTHLGGLSASVLMFAILVGANESNPCESDDSRLSVSDGILIGQYYQRFEDAFRAKGLTRQTVCDRVAHWMQLTWARDRSMPLILDMDLLPHIQPREEQLYMYLASMLMQSNPRQRHMLLHGIDSLYAPGHQFYDSLGQSHRIARERAEAVHPGARQLSHARARSVAELLRQISLPAFLHMQPAKVHDQLYGPLNGRPPASSNVSPDQKAETSAEQQHPRRVQDYRTRSDPPKSLRQAMDIAYGDAVLPRSQTSENHE